MTSRIDLEALAVRDRFASQAFDVWLNRTSPYGDHYNADYVAARAYEYADAMIAARKAVQP